MATVAHGRAAAAMAVVRARRLDALSARRSPHFLSRVVVVVVVERTRRTMHARAVTCAPFIARGWPSHLSRARSSPRRRAARIESRAQDAENDAETNPNDDANDDITNASSALGDVISSPLFYVTFGVAGGVILVQKLGENAAFALSAFPIVGLTLISKTDFGAKLQQNIEDKRPALEADKARKEIERAAARAKSTFYGEDRVKFLGDVDFDYPAYLDGSLCGDVGFDPLGFSKDPKDLAKYREFELLHGRWAMLGVVGAALPEFLQTLGVVDLGERAVWWKVGAWVLRSDIELNYLGMSGFHIAGGSGIAIIAVCQLVLMGGPEYARKVGIESLVPVGVWLPGDADYPGGAPFDPFKFSDNAEEFEKQKVMEIKHGRLAMVAMAGVFAQAFITRSGCVENVLQALGAA